MDLDGLRNKAEDLLREHDDQVAKGVDRAEELAKQRVRGHDEQIDQAADRLRRLLPDSGDAPSTEPPR